MKRYIIFSYTLLVSLLSIIAGCLITHTADSLRIDNLEHTIDERNILLHQQDSLIHEKDSLINRYRILLTPYTIAEV